MKKSFHCLNRHTTISLCQTTPERTLWNISERVSHTSISEHKLWRLYTGNAWQTETFGMPCDGELPLKKNISRKGSSTLKKTFLLGCVYEGKQSKEMHSGDLSPESVMPVVLMKNNMWEERQGRQGRQSTEKPRLIVKTPYNSWTHPSTVHHSLDCARDGKTMGFHTETFSCPCSFHSTVLKYPHTETNTSSTLHFKPIQHIQAPYSIPLSSIWTRHRNVRRLPPLQWTTETLKTLKTFPWFLRLSISWECSWCCPVLSFPSIRVNRILLSPFMCCLFHRRF